jgi:hypothetical protein
MTLLSTRMSHSKLFIVTLVELTFQRMVLRHHPIPHRTSWSEQIAWDVPEEARADVSGFAAVRKTRMARQLWGAERG